LLTGLPTLDRESQRACDAPLSLSELTVALNKANKGKALGLDGRTYEFYAIFWNCLGPLFLNVVSRSLQEEKLPPSMLKGVVILVPKHGDPMDLKTWRPITLLNRDYKLITRCLANRITAVLPMIISSYQSFCVRGRSIHTKLHLIRDAIAYANTDNIPLAVISLDQTSAYDCVEHNYLKLVLHKYGFGPRYISQMKAVYKGAQGLIKIRDTLLGPFQYGTGLRQGDPLSGPLFTLTMGPLLKMCQDKLGMYGLPVPGQYPLPLVTSAYADDITIFLTKDEGFCIS
jgi:hypothetical protein